GYSHHELAELLGIRASTVRGRLYHGRRRLRRAPRPPADEGLTPPPSPREGDTKGTPAGIDAHVALLRRLAFSTDCLVMMQERSGPRQLALEGVDAAPGEVVERIVDGQQPLTPTTHDLLPHLVAALAGRVEQVTIRRLAGQALYADVTLQRSGRRREVE